MNIKINKSEYNNYTISIENFDDFGLILLVFEEIKKILTIEDLCSNFFDIWDNICKKIGFNDKAIIDYFNLFISSIIKRRKNNVNNWLEEIIKDNDNLKELKNQYSLIIIYGYFVDKNVSIVTIIVVYYKVIKMNINALMTTNAKKYVLCV